MCTYMIACATRVQTLSTCQPLHVYQLTMSSKAGVSIDRSKTSHGRLSEVDTLRLGIAADIDKINI